MNELEKYIREKIKLEEKIEHLENQNRILKNNCNEYLDKLGSVGLKEEEYKAIIESAIECINYYAIENDDYSKIYSNEESELLEILKGEK